MDPFLLPPLSMLRAFEAAARRGGFSAAGRELNVTHAAVAQQVRKLEHHLGVKLMRRDGRGVSLTREGEQLAGRLAGAFGAMQAAIQEVTTASAERPVTITLTPAFSATWLIPRMTSFRAAHPNIEVMLSPTIDLIDMETSDIDIAIRFGAGHWPGLLAAPLLSSPVAMVAHPDLLARHPVQVPADLLGLPWVQETGTGELKIWLEEHGVNVAQKTDVLHLPGYLAVDALRTGQGAGLTARAFVEADIEAGRLISLFDDAQDNDTGYYVAHRDEPLRQTVKDVIAWLHQDASYDVN